MSPSISTSDGTIATNTPIEPVVWSRARIAGLDLLRVGLEKQPMLEKWGDNVRIDWGYFYVGVPDAQGEATFGRRQPRRSKSLCG